MTLDVLVIGRTGQLARCLADQAPGIPNCTFEFWGRDTLDLSKSDEIADCIVNRSPGIIINTAAYTAVDRAEGEPDLAMDVNGTAPGEVARGAAACGASIIHVSTDYVFDGSSDKAYLESDPVSPLGMYGRSKFAGEENVAAFNAQHLILRTAWVYSPYGNNFVKTMMRLARERDAVSVVDDQIGNPTSATDLASAMVFVLKRLRDDPNVFPFGTYHITGKGTASWWELASCVIDIFADAGYKKPIVKPVLTVDFATKAARPQNSRLNCTKFEATFDYRMPRWPNSVEKVVYQLMNGV